MINKVDNGISCEFCPFCDEMAGRDNLFDRLLGEQIGDRTILSSENFIVWPGMGPVSEGYLLLLTKRHLLSMASIEKSMLNELKELRQQSIELLRSAYGKHVISFEHGPGNSSSKGGNCVDHAHIHFVTTDQDFYADFNEYFNWKIVDPDWDLLFSLQDRAISYLYYQDIGGTEYAAIAPHSLPSQFFRRLIGEKLRFYPDWNWRTSPNPEAVLKMYNRLQSTLHER